MSVDEQINLLKSTTCFSKMSTFYSEQKYKYKKSFHDSIKNSKDNIYSLFEKEPLYRELMPVISKSKRGNVYYNQLVKKNLKNNERKSAFYENLMRVIQEVQKKKKKQEKVKHSKSTDKHLFMVPKIDILRKKRDKIESYLLKKYKTYYDEIKTLHKSRSTLDHFKFLNKEDSQNNFFKYFNNPYTNNININNITNTSKENDQIFSLETLHTFNQLNDGSMRNNLKEKSLNLTKFSIVSQPKRAYHSTTKKFTRKSIDLSEYFQKQERFMYQKQKKFTKILKKCEENISQGKFVEEDIHNISKQTDPISIENKFKNARQNDDKKIIDDLNKEGSKKYQEYKKIQEEKFNNLKKNMDLKLSDEYAYIIQKDLQNNFGVNGTVLPYELYQKDMSKIKEKIDNDLLTEKKKIKKVKHLLDDVYRKKEFLKHKIDIYKMKQDKFNEIKNVNKKKKGEDVSHNYENEDVKGTLLPKLIKMRDQCHGSVDYDFDKE